MRHENFDDAVDFRTQWLSNKDTSLDGVKNFEVKALLPLKFSPMQ
eukprot:06619.XXX_375759_375509_1 [CDS] Oithona nana genome sequencing.